MAMVCPRCNGAYEQALHCPTCGVRLLYQSHQGRARSAEASDIGQWLHTPLGRVITAILLAQGLAYGLQLLCTAGVMAAQEAETSVWSTLYGLVLLQAVQGLSLLAGGALAGAGQRRAFFLGAFVGLVHGLIFLVAQEVRGDKVTDVSLYGQPILHVAFGAIGAVIGASIWRPLPTLAMPEFDIDTNFKPARGRRPLLAALRGPVAWGRVAAGVGIVAVGFLWGPALFTAAMEAGQAPRITDKLQATLVTWEIIGLATLLGAAIAGSTTRNGLKQGLCVGIGASVVLVTIYLSDHSPASEKALYTVASILPLTIAGGWFGGQLFPPVYEISRGRRAGSTTF
jgi:hypothetical protein